MLQKGIVHIHRVVLTTYWPVNSRNHINVYVVSKLPCMPVDFSVSTLVFIGQRFTHYLCSLTALGSLIIGHE